MKDRRLALTLGGIFLLSLTGAWLLRFCPDDAFITFRYAQNLALGHGPVWNAGEQPVEGYSTFLWMLLMSLPHFLHLDVLLFARLAGLISLAGMLGFAWKIFRRQLDKGPSLLLLALLGTHFTLMSFATSGMETVFFGFLVVLNAWLYERFLQRGMQSGFEAFLMGLALALLPLTRPEGAFFALPLAGVVAWKIQKSTTNRAPILLLLLGFGIPVVSWLVWKIAFYGEILPNTFYAKTGNVSLLKGMLYAGLFGMSFFLPLVLVFPLKNVLKSVRAMGIYALWLMGWLVYLVVIGGDFMEFRMWIPVLPFIYLLAGKWIFRPEVGRFRGFLVLALLALSNLVHGFSFGKLYYTGFVISRGRLDHEVAEPARGLADLGRNLAGLLGRPSDLRLAVSQAGALPYYAGLPCTDILGLNDAWVARNGKIISTTPGHQRSADPAYLQTQGVNWIVGRLVYASKADFPTENPEQRPEIRQLCLLEEGQEMTRFVHALLYIPLRDGSWWVAAEMKRHPDTDDLVARNLILRQKLP
ncbi:MAG: glycosyltransferase family 39 protein [Bacteroidia bacterium]|nr:glycosyltransferase family 39 protein [Bacteroidia bacterium]